MRTSIRTLRLTVAAVVAAVGLSIVGIGAALAAPGTPAKPAIEHHAKFDRGSKFDRSTKRERSAKHERGAKREKASHQERSDRMRDR